jgi:hypothetical protein
MDRAIAEKTITIILTEIHLRLDEAARIAKAAEACDWLAASPKV